MKICLISCTKDKQNYTCPAKEMYLPSLRFRLSYDYAKNIIKADGIFILSAKYGLLSENDIIETYDKTLNNMPRAKQIEWSNNIIQALKIQFNLDTTEFIILAGNNYYKDLIKHMKNYRLPLKGMALGVGNSYLKQIISLEKS